MLYRIFLGSVQAQTTMCLARSGFVLPLYKSHYAPFSQCAIRRRRRRSTKEPLASSANSGREDPPLEESKEIKRADIRSTSSIVPWDALLLAGAIILGLVYWDAKTGSEQRQKARRLNIAIRSAFDEEMKQSTVEVATSASNRSHNDCMTRMIVSVRVARRVRPPDPADIQSVHSYLQTMVLILNLMTLGPKLAEEIGGEPLEFFDFEPKTLRKLVKSTKDPSTSRLAEKAEKKLFDIQLQACWDIYNILNPESTSSLRTGKMDEIYVEEAVEVIMDRIKTARSFTPVFKEVIERAREVEETRRWVKKLKR